jgi:hypothetical protein
MADAGHQHLNKWFNEKLCIDEAGALKEIDVLYPTKVNTGIVRGKIIRDPYDGRFKALRAVKRLAENDFYHHVDSNIGRLHSNLTCLKKDLRKYLTYNGKRLVNLDIRNSQPLISGILLNPAFYQSEACFSLFSIPSLQQLLNNKHKNINNIAATIHSTIMLCPLSQNEVQAEFREYLRIVQSGRFYEEVSEILFPDEEVSRDKIKEIVFTLFFADNRHGPKLRQTEKPFKERFSNVYKVFSLLKRHNKTILSHILQRVESRLIIETITRRIATERPELPLFTVHDSIATTVGNEAYVEGVMKDEIRKLTGLKACIGREHWS